MPPGSETLLQQFRNNHANQVAWKKFKGTNAGSSWSIAPVDKIMGRSPSPSVETAASTNPNYGYHKVFSRQIQALGQPGDTAAIGCPLLCVRTY
jgi:hypothetical protein